MVGGMAHSGGAGVLRSARETESAGWRARVLGSMASFGDVMNSQSCSFPTPPLSLSSLRSSEARQGRSTLEATI